MDSDYYILNNNEKGGMINMTSYKNQATTFFDNLETPSKKPGSRSFSQLSANLSYEDIPEIDSNTFIKDKEMPERQRAGYKQSVSSMDYRTYQDQKPKDFSSRANFNKIGNSQFSESLNYRTKKPYEMPALSLSKQGLDKIGQFPLTESIGHRFQRYELTKKPSYKSDLNRFGHRYGLSESLDLKTTSTPYEYSKYYERTKKFEKKDLLEFLDSDISQKPFQGAEENEDLIQAALKTETRASGFDEFKMTLYLSEKDAVTDEFICVKCRKKLLLSKYYIHKSACSNYSAE